MGNQISENLAIWIDIKRIYDKTDISTDRVIEDWLNEAPYLSDKKIQEGEAKFSPEGYAAIAHLSKCAVYSFIKEIGKHDYSEFCITPCRDEKNDETIQCTKCKQYNDERERLYQECQIKGYEFSYTYASMDALDNLMKTLEMIAMHLGLGIHDRLVNWYRMYKNTDIMDTTTPTNGQIEEKYQRVLTGSYKHLCVERLAQFNGKSCPATCTTCNDLHHSLRNTYKCMRQLARSLDKSSLYNSVIRYIPLIGMDEEAYNTQQDTDEIAYRACKQAADITLAEIQEHLRLC